MSSSSAEATQAKQPVTPLAGPYGHPFHPLLVTVPIGAWVASLVFDVISRVGDEPAVFENGAWWLILVGIAGALVAAAFGLLDLLAIPRGTRVFKVALVHMSLNLAVVGLFAVGLGLRQGRLDGGGGIPTGLLALSIIALAALGASGWLGGMLTYRYGVRVVDQAEQADGYRS